MRYKSTKSHFSHKFTWHSQIYKSQGHWRDDGSHCTASPTAVFSEPDSCFSSGRGLFEHCCGFKSLLSLALFLDGRDVDESVLDSAGCGGDAPADGEESRSSGSSHGLVRDDKV